LNSSPLVISIGGWATLLGITITFAATSLVHHSKIGS
jgi:hypothetical protein